MQSDTVIGIVGAVVLVAVMVGVFAYEYNNSPIDTDDGPDLDTDEGRRLAFAEAYPSLEASEDLDGDGTPNFEDDDIDGDGTDDATQEMFMTDIAIAGTVAGTSGTSPSETTEPFFIGTGHGGATVTISYEVTVNPVTGAALDDMGVDILNPDGEPTRCDETLSGTTATCSMEIPAGSLAGEYHVRVTGSLANPQAREFSGNVVAIYPL